MFGCLNFGVPRQHSSLASSAARRAEETVLYILGYKLSQRVDTYVEIAPYVCTMDTRENLAIIRARIHEGILP